VYKHGRELSAPVGVDGRLQARALGVRVGGGDAERSQQGTLGASVRVMLAALHIDITLDDAEMLAEPV
jgi:hypothetical protein